MSIAQENPDAHEPQLSRRHDAGPAHGRLSPAERALAPESDAPMQSDSAETDDQVYVGRNGGYMGGSDPTAHGRLPQTNPRGDGTYGYPAGPGVGVPGGEHQPAAQTPDVLPPQYPER